MQKNFFIIIGVLIALLPFISVPNKYKTPIYIILGSSVAFASYRERYLKKKLAIPHIKRFKKSSPVSVVTNSQNDLSVKANSSDENATQKVVQ